MIASSPPLAVPRSTQRLSSPVKRVGYVVEIEGLLLEERLYRA
jgi:hypothetical protein